MGLVNNTGIQVSVIIATHNRVALLQKAIEGLQDQSLSKELFEVIVVDNASTDTTKEYIISRTKNNAWLKYIYESKPGANIARNTGWQMANGAFIAFLDDDAIPHPHWLENIVSSFRNVKPTPAIVGGKVLPIWEVEKPNWLHGNMLKALSLLDYGDTPRLLTEKEFFYSVNMVFQKKLLAEFGGFDTGLGRRGGMLTSNDEILIAKKIRAAGYKFYYNPLIAVDHHIPATRLKKSWFISRYFSQGYSDALMWRLLEKPNLGKWLQRLFFHFYIFLRNPKYITRLFYMPQQDEQLYLKLIAHSRLGFIKGLFVK